MSLRVHLTEPGAPIEPGSEGVASVTVVNTSAVVRAYRLDLVGTTTWAFVEPRELRLFPEQAGDALVHFRPPKSPEVVSGSHAFAVKVSATDEAALSMVEEGTVNVAPFVAADLMIRPKTARGSRKAKYRLVLTNTGNTRQSFDLSAGDEDEMLEMKLANDTVALDPGETGAVGLVARTFGRVSRGERLPFTATAEGPGLTPTSTSGALAIAPALGPWIARAAIALFVLLLLVGGFLLTRSGDPKTSAGERRVSETTATTQPNLVTTVAATVPGETTLAPLVTPAPVDTPAPQQPSPQQPTPQQPTPQQPSPQQPSPQQPAPVTTVPTTVPTTPPPTTTTTLPPLPPAQLSRTPADVFLPLPYPSVYKLQSVTIAAGTWTVYSKGTAVNFGAAGDFVRCTLWNATANPPAQLDYATDWVGPTAQTRVISNVIQLTVSVPTVIDQKCQHDGANGNQAKIDRAATLVAFPARASADQAWSVSAGDIFLGTNTNVASVSVGAGTWLVGFKATGVKLDAVAGNVNCKPDAPSSNSGGVTVGGGPTASTMTGYTMVSGPTTVSLLCTGPPGSKTDPRATLWAYRVAGGVRTTGGCNTSTTASAQLLLVNYGTCTVSGGGVHTKGAALRATVGAGTWVWLGAEGLISSANDFGRCGTFADGLGSGGATQVHPGRLAMNNLGSLLTFGVTTNVDIACAADNSTITHGGTHVLLKLG